jgi:hypothetical protein
MKNKRFTNLQVKIKNTKQICNLLKARENKF